MISVIICSRTPEIDPSFKLNIQHTIGLEHEIISIDNSRNQYNIFTAYNIGVKQSKYPYLCFVHDDVSFHTQDWGLKVCEHFKDENAGALGISGTTYLPFMPGYWWSGNLVNEAIIPNTANSQEPVFKYYPEKTPEKNQVVVLDGVLMFFRRGLFDKIKFDESCYQGYHFYDVDTCVQIARLGYKAYCIFDILVRHDSLGGLNEDWLQSALLFHKKWKNNLPISCTRLTHSKICWVEFRTLDEFLDIFLDHTADKRVVYSFMIRMVFSYPRGYFYYRMPVYLSRYVYKIMTYKKRDEITGLMT